MRRKPKAELVLTVPEGATHWSTRTMAREAGLTQTMVSRIWRAFGLETCRSAELTTVVKLLKMPA